MKVPTRTSVGVLGSGRALQGPSGAGGTPEAFGAQVGRSLMGAAQATMGLATFVREQEEKKQRFQALQAFSRFQTEQRLRLNEAKRAYQPGTGGLYESFGESYRQAQEAFVETLPPDLQDEFRVRAAEVGSALALDTMQFQYETNDTFYKQGIQDALNEARIEIGQDGSKENLERQRGRLDELINASGLSVPEANSVRRTVYTSLEAVAYRQAQIARLRDEASGVGTDVSQAADILTEVSGMPPDAAERSAQQAAGLAVQSLGSLDRWAQLPIRIRAVLISVAAQQGGLSPEIVGAVAEGDMDQLASVLRAGGNELEGDLVNNPEAGIDNDPAFANVPYEDRLALLADAQREVSAMISAEAQQEKATQQSLVNALHVALHDGTAGQADIDAARESGVLTDYDDIVKAEKILSDRDEQLALRQLGLQIATGSVTYVPGNETHEKTLNSLIGEAGLTVMDQGTREQASEYAANVLIPLVRNAGVPTDVVDLLQGMIRSNDSDRAYWALDLMQQIERANPKAMLNFADDDRRTLDLWQSRKDFLTQEEMMKEIRGPLDPAERNARLALRKAGEKLFTEGPMQGFDPLSLFTGAPGLFGPQGVTPPNTPWVRQQLEGDFQQLFLDNFERTGDVEQAKRDASKQLLRVWGVTQVGENNSVMKYPPEKFYPPVRDSYDWMEAQLRRDGLLADGESFQLIADMQTESEWGVTAPSYLFVKKVDGVWTPVPGKNGLPARVFFNWGQEEEADEQAWRAAQKGAQDIRESQRLMGAAVQHSLDTGVPIPAELLDPEGQTGGMLELLMRSNEATLKTMETP